MDVLWKKITLYALAAINLIIVLSFWIHGSFFKNMGTADVIIALGKLCGLLAVNAVLLQLLLIGRVRWTESIFGLDRLSRFHHYNGIVAICLIIIHPIFLTIGYAMNAHTGLMTQFLGFITGYKYVIFSFIALLLFLTIIFFSLLIVRRKLKYETWYYIHIFMYAAILLAYFHQLAVGTDFLTQSIFRIYWIVLYVFVALNLLLFRFAKPIYNSAMHKFKVEKIVKETDDSTSVYISGKNLKNFHVAAGQFIIVRFLSKKFWLQAHPFSISGFDIDKNNKNDYIRITVKAVGDYTKTIPDLKRGTSVLIDGPHGIFTTRRAHKKKFLFIAGGIGITPIKSMLEECTQNKWDATLLYSVKKEDDIVFASELEKLAGIKIHYSVSEPGKNWKGDKGRLDEAKLRLVKDIKQREIYICGPVPMMSSMILILKDLSVKDENIHHERFAL